MNSKLIGNPAHVRKLTAGALRLQSSKIANRSLCTLLTTTDASAVPESVVINEDSSGSFAKIHSLPSIVYRDFPFPGNVGIVPTQPRDAVDVTSDSLSSQSTNRQSQLAVYVENLKRELQGFELEVHACPTLLRSEFSSLFPNKGFANGPLSVVTFSRKTKNDMKFWSLEVENERTAVFRDLISAAVQSVNFLNEHGYWADFIDPYSGKPYYSPATSDTLTESDERMCHFNFVIKDMVCYKVILHRDFGFNVIVGVLFTNAPSQSEPLQLIAGH
uniref:Methylmalonic aciduria and homocystinuria type D protein, mitochondrial n=1 Tax=Trichuris muris TaxID=70415 RepID=A0A5S6QH33_TRIMR